MRDVFEMINNAYARYYNPSEHLAEDEVIDLFKRRVVLKQYIPPPPPKKKINVLASKFSDCVIQLGTLVT
jgi:hypothetical protein